MKQLTGLLLSAALLLTGCGGKMSPWEEEPTEYHTDPPKTTALTEETSPAETAPADAELQRRIDAIYVLEPQPVPAGGWTDETLLPVINIGREPAELPLCLADLLYGYAVDGEFADFYTAYAEDVFYHDLFAVGHQCHISDAFGELEFPPREETHNPALPDGADDHTLTLNAAWAVVTEDGFERLTFSVNCVTVGSTYDELVSRIGLSGNDRLPGDDDSGRFFIRCQTESLSLMFSGSDGIVDTITLHDRSE